MMKDLHGILIEKGKKLKLGNVEIKPISPLEELVPMIVCLSSNLFVIVLQTDWTRKEIRNAANRIAVDIAEIDGVLDLIFRIDNCIDFDVAYNAANTDPEIQFEHVEEGTGVAFHIIFIDTNCTVLHQRLCSLDDDKSNALIDTLNEQREKHYSKETYTAMVNRLYNEMSVQEILANSFIHQNFFKRR